MARFQWARDLFARRRNRQRKRAAEEEKQKAREFILRRYKASFEQRTVHAKPILEIIAVYQARIGAIQMGMEAYIKTGTASQNFLRHLSQTAVDLTTRGNAETRRNVINTEIKRLEERVRDYGRLAKAATREEYSDILEEMLEKNPRKIHTGKR